MRRPVEMATVRALRYALDEGLGDDRGRCGQRAARELVDLAGGSRLMLERALRRIDRGLAQRSSAVGERAREVLQQALDLAADEPGSSRELVSIRLQ